MKQDLTKILDKIQPLTAAFKRYRLTIFIVTFLGIYVFLIMRISTLVNSEPTLQAVSEQMEAVDRLELDQESIDRLMTLEEQNIEVKALFEQARDNPFTE